jgi:hypothetical protein
VNVTLNVNDDAELRSAIKDAIRGAVKSIVREEISEIIATELRGKIRGDITAKVDIILREELGKEIRKNLSIMPYFNDNKQIDAVIVSSVEWYLQQHHDLIAKQAFLCTTDKVVQALLKAVKNG